jgi:hypothetical protein
MVTFALVPMIAMVGLVIDIGYMHYLKQSAQAAADAAAAAAIYRFDRTMSGSSFSCSSTYPWMCNPSPWSCPANLTTAGNPVETACLYAKDNGFYPTNSSQNVTIVSHITPTIPTAPGVNGVGWWITVRVTQTVPQLFSAIMGNTTGMIAARATAAIQPGLGCVYALDPVAPGAYYQNGTTTFQSACAIYVNSSDPSSAMLGNGGATLQASAINITGGYNWQGTISPPPNTGVPPSPDPLGNLQPPSPPCSSTTGCDAADCSAHPNTVVVNGNTTLQPGVYCGGIRVKNGTATFATGSYVIVGGGISTQDSNSHVRGSGLFFYNTYSSTNSYGPINFNANSDVQIAADTSGPYAGILFMQDRGCCATTIPTESFQGGATSFFEGVLYFPRSLVQFAGNPSLDISHYTIVVARRFAVQGTSTMNNDYSHLTGGNPIKRTGLVE